MSDSDLRIPGNETVWPPYLSVRDLYIPMIAVHLFASAKGGSMVGIFKSLTDT
jgi:hypothetical protein